MNCKDFEERCMTAGGKLSAEAQAHFETCVNCRRFAKIVACINASEKSDRDMQTEILCKSLVAANAGHRTFTWHAITGRVACVAAALILLGIVWTMTGSKQVEPVRTEISQASAENEAEWSEAEILQDEIFLVAADDLSNKVSDLEISVSFLACGL